MFIIFALSLCHIAELFVSDVLAVGMQCLKLLYIVREYYEHHNACMNIDMQAHNFLVHNNRKRLIKVHGTAFHL